MFPWSPAATPRIGNGEITVNVPVASDGTIGPLVQRTDYYDADGRALDYTFADGAGPDDLTGMTPILTFAGRQITGAVIVATGSGRKVRFELSRQHTDLKAREYTFHILLQRGNGHWDKPLVGTLTIARDGGPNDDD